ncbi:prolipoprotein diacylglyceryl transferase [Mycobacterium [tuberculosis] TKK-01-0051]|uniref:Phosphatidylglycerol--prolipoprotein diacylglyceryl transferase n=1 Tax=Mycobacterium [tuberculosis] TKK-01-0051 TaxID=1324261 RepID=A0A051U3Z6_9MYCO|nr:prolipoprotein diacylglyceryl transferase [Mycobacterium colombiense]KBZ63904.1 prolipoprotein diacylglyceryl transferase [Mycobacterium [tuberculosis] TKK-01-0051]
MTKLLAYFPSPPRGVWHLGPLPIRAYALFIIAGIVAALLIGDRRWEARGGERGVIYDIALWTVPFGLVGGRLYHLATDWRTYWGPGGAGLGAAVRIWDGGLGIWGAVALGAVGAWIGCRRHGIPLPAFADALAPGIILAQAIGRLGNYFNQELYGRETTLPWGLEVFYRRDPSGYIDPHSLDGVSTGQLAFVVQPTFLYELIWNLLIFVALLYADRRFTLGHGRLFALYVAGYCVGRFCVELLRDDTATHIAGIRINSFTSTFVFIGAVVYLMAAPKGREDPESLRGNEYLDEEAAEAEPDAEPATVAAATTAAAAAATTAAGDAPTSSAETAEADDTTAADADAEESVADTAAATEAEPSAAEAEEPEAEEAASEEPEEPEAEETEEPEKAEAEAESEDSEAGAEAEEPEAEEAEAEEAEAEEPEAEEAEAEEPEAEAEEPEVKEPEAEAAVQDSEAEEPEAEEPEAEEPEAEEPEAEEPEADEASAETPEPETPEPETPETKPTPTEPETRRRWGSRLRNRLSGR